MISTSQCYKLWWPYHPRHCPESPFFDKRPPFHSCQWFDRISVLSAIVKDHFAFFLEGFLAAGFTAFFFAFTGTIGTSQQVMSHSSHPQTSSTMTTIPHTSQVYFSLRMMRLAPDQTGRM
jgi:hypothetical protein